MILIADLSLLARHAKYRTETRRLAGDFLIIDLSGSDVAGTGQGSVSSAR